ncbi:hypothetical protein SEA1_gp0036 [Salmonella phage SEA1]|nr:hypothetical protein SEA1_gp0036 [Salmonella phage SEA1]
MKFGCRLDKNKKYHYTYCTTNLINGKLYYGVHSTDDLNDGYRFRQSD